MVTTWPWSTFVGHPHWQQIEWLPSSRGPRVFDSVANVILFLPLGVLLEWRRPSPSIRRAALIGAMFSLAIESYQVFCHNHFPTVRDVLANTTGSWLGARLASYLSSR